MGTPKQKTTSKLRAKPLTEMQHFFFTMLQKTGDQLSPAQMAATYYTLKGVRRFAASRDSFGQTAAAYRTCRFLVEKGLAVQHTYKTEGGYTYTKYTAVKKANTKK